MHVSLSRLWGDHIQRRGSALALLMALAALLQLAAGVGLAYVANFSSVRAVLGNFQPVWLAGLVGALGISFAGYYRVLALWLPMPASLALLPAIRKLGENEIPEAESEAEPPDEPGLRHSA